MPVFALVDCNNFYASCEKLFNPKLKDRPVVVLSNNDGCVVARSAEAKALGIPMGEPWFKLQNEARRYGIVACSSNYELYSDLSNRCVEVLSGFTPNLEVYSIDESFLELSGFERLGYQAYGQQIRQRVADWLGLAVCVGIGPSKTLAKLANYCAKKGLAGQDGVYRRAGPTHALGQQGRRERAKLLVLRTHRAPAPARRQGGQPLGVAVQVEPGQARVARKAEQIKAPALPRPGGRQARVAAGVPVVVEQQQGLGIHAAVL